MTYKSKPKLHQLSEENIYVVINKKTRELYDEAFYSSEQAAQFSIKSGSYYVALHDPQVIKLEQLMYQVLEDFEYKNCKPGFSFNREKFGQLTLDEAIAFFRLIGQWPIKQ